MPSPRPQTNHRQRDHDQASNERLQHSRDYLFDGNPRNVDGGEQAIFDFSRPLKFGDQRHGDRPDSREHHADRDDSGQQQALICGGHVAAAHHDASRR